MKSSDLTVYAASPTAGIALHREVAMSISSRPLDRGELKGLETAISVAAKAHGSAAFMYVMDPSKGLVVPDDTARREMVELLRRINERVHATSVVILAGGFSGAVLRGAATSVGLIVRPTGAAKVFAEIGEAVAWVASQPVRGGAPRGRAEALQMAYDDLRARMTSG